MNVVTSAQSGWGAAPCAPLVFFGSLSQLWEINPLNVSSFQAGCQLPGSSVHIMRGKNELVDRAGLINRAGQGGFRICRKALMYEGTLGLSESFEHKHPTSVIPQNPTGT